MFCLPKKPQTTKPFPATERKTQNPKTKLKMKEKYLFFGQVSLKESMVFY